MAGEKQQAVKPTCLITGVGPATGSALVRRFAQDYQVAMIARDQDRLLALEEEVPGSRSFICDVSDQEAFGQALDNIRARMGAPAVIIHNAVSGIWCDVLSIDPKRLQLNFQINTMALLQLIQAFGPDMVDAGHGSILATGNTAAYRGRDQFAAFAPSKAAQRILLESAARLLGPKNIHVAYVAIAKSLGLLDMTPKAAADRESIIQTQFIVCFVGAEHGTENVLSVGPDGSGKIDAAAGG